jgi:hypothetical protein
LPLSEIATALDGSAGVVVSACMEEEIDRNTGSPTWWRRVTANQTPVTDRLGQLGCPIMTKAPPNCGPTN